MYNISCLLFLHLLSSFPLSSFFLPSIFLGWFKFTLKPPYSGASEHSLLAIWDTSHWNFFVKFGLRTAWDISYDILLSLLKFVNFWWLQGRLSILAKIGCLQKIKSFLDEGVTGLRCDLGVLGSQITRLYDGTIFGGGVMQVKGVSWAVKKTNWKITFFGTFVMA